MALNMKKTKKGETSLRCISNTNRRLKKIIRSCKTARGGKCYTYQLRNVIRNGRNVTVQAYGCLPPSRNTELMCRPKNTGPNNLKCCDDSNYCNILSSRRAQPSSISDGIAAASIDQVPYTYILIMQMLLFCFIISFFIIVVIFIITYFKRSKEARSISSASKYIAAERVDDDATLVGIYDDDDEDEGIHLSRETLLSVGSDVPVLNRVQQINQDQPMETESWETHWRREREAQNRMDIWHTNLRNHNAISQWSMDGVYPQ